MKFIKCDFTTLMKACEVAKAYAGATTQPIEQYIESKGNDDFGRYHKDHYNLCYYSLVEDIKAAEQTLLDSTPSPAANIDTVSRMKPVQGFVYVCIRMN